MGLGDPLTRVLGKIPGGRVLDVATSDGGFVGVLAAHLKSYASITGIDLDTVALAGARGRYGDRGFAFAKMDAGRLGFASRSMDTVTFSATLHHLPDPPRALAEAVRILKPRGYFVLAEMHSDGQTEAQRTMVRAHHWVADVDAALGGFHNHTMSRQEIVVLVEALGLGRIKLYDTTGTDADPMDTQRRETLEDTLDHCLERTRLANDHRALTQYGEALRQRIHRLGVQPEPVLIVVGVKE